MERRKPNKARGRRRRPDERKGGFNRENDLESWKPRTALGRAVKSGEIKSIDEILSSGMEIRESEIVDSLLPDLEIEFIPIGQSKGKFGGGKRRIYRVTQKTTAEGQTVKFTVLAIAGNSSGYIGMGSASSGETVPTRKKAEKEAKLSLFKVGLGCGSWECSCADPHSLPFAVKGGAGSVEVTLKPAPKGTGLAVNDTCKQILSIVGIKDTWAFTRGQTQTRINLAKATFNALKQLRSTKL
ncbi:MAG: 30S ribosomal protein S5 [Nanoarchaeota archaeon]|nr:30S ribosomal protein S5 [Nanoarchaeota archaeon]